MVVHGFLEDTARRQADAVAIVDGARTVTYGELDALANRFAQILAASDVQRHDRVILALENSIELAAAYFGVLKAGAVAVPLAAGGRNNRVSSAVRDCAPSAAIVDGSVVPEIAATGGHDSLVVFVTGRRGNASLPPGMRRLDEALAAAPAEAPARRPIEPDLAAIIYTSGSTGEPRGVMLTHHNIVANTRSIVSYLGLTAADRVMCVLPFHYVYGLSLLHTHVAVGGSIVLDNRFAFPNVVLTTMQRHAVTGFAGVPSSFALLLHRSDLGSIPVPSLRYATQAGGAMPVPHLREWLARGWPVPFFVMYGATEAAARLTFLEPSRLSDKLGSIGRAIPGVEITVRRDDGTIGSAGEVGELIARGSNISPGYWNNAAETSEKFGPDGYRTGDLGYMDAEGFLFLVGRRHDMLKVGAHRVGAREIEDVLLEHPGVADAAVVGAPHDLLGETPVAFVALRAGAVVEAEALRGYCAAKLPPHKVPARIAIREELPKIAGIGKIDKRALREEVGNTRVMHV
jgi:long-chain acyl-CoA synthetase